MTRYAVFLHGENVVQLDEAGDKVTGGVYCWKCVEADDVAEAEKLAIQKLWKDEVFVEDMWNEVDNPPAISAEEIKELNEDVDIEDADSACIFYVEEEGSKTPS